MQFLFCGNGCMQGNRDRQLQQELVIDETPKLMLTRQSSLAFLDEFQYAKNQRYQTKQTKAESIRNYNTSSFSHKNSRVFSPRSVISDLHLDLQRLSQIPIEIYDGEMTPGLNNQSVRTARQKHPSGCIEIYQENWAEIVFKGFKTRKIIRSIIITKLQNALKETDTYLVELKTQIEIDDLHKQMIEQITKQQQQQRVDIVKTINSLIEDPNWIKRINKAKKLEENRIKRIKELKEKKVKKQPDIQTPIKQTKIQENEPIKKFTFLKKGLGLISSQTAARQILIVPQQKEEIKNETLKHEFLKKCSFNDTKSGSSVNSKVDCWKNKKLTLDDKMNLSQETIVGQHTINKSDEEGFDKLLSLLDEGKTIDDIISDQAGGQEDTKTLQNIKILMNQINEQMNKESQIQKRKFDFEFEKMLVQLRREYHSLFV